MTTASAPGKIILFGEHAVVYNRPALAVPVIQVHADVKITDLNWPAIWIDAPDIKTSISLELLAEHNFPNPFATTIYNTLDMLGLSGPPVPFFNVYIHSTIPVASGLGSGAAVSVAIIRAISTHFKRPLTDEQINEIAYETEKFHHGTPSGIDNTVITYSKPVYFVRGQPIETFSVAQPFTIVIGNTGISAPTKESVGDVRKLWEADKSRWEAVFDQVAGVVQDARKAIESGKWQELGPLMDTNHALLQEITVSSHELDRLVLAAKAAGALGAKLSGGGRGGNMMALVNPEDADKVASALLSAGAKNTITTTIQ